MAVDFPAIPSIVSETGKYRGGRLHYEWLLSVLSQVDVFAKRLRLTAKRIQRKPSE